MGRKSVKTWKIDGITVRFRTKFVTPWEQYKDRIGQKFVVIGLPSKKDYDKDEVGRMWMIQFEDGTKTTAWPEEVERDVLVNGRRWPAWDPR